MTPILPCELALAAIKADTGIQAMIGDRASHKWGFERVADPDVFDVVSGDLKTSVTVRQANDANSDTYGLYLRIIEVAVGATSVDSESHLEVQYTASLIRTLLSGTGDEGNNPLFQSSDYPEFSTRPPAQMQFRYEGGGPLDVRLADIAEYTTMLFSTGTAH